MSRRSSRKTENIPLYNTGDDENSDTPSATPKKGRKAVKAEAVPVVAKSPAKSKKSAKTKTESDEESEPSEPPSKIKINSVKAKALKEDTVPKAKQPAKRKIKDGDDENEDPEEGQSKKKRKTKEEKEAEEAMPVAVRTAVASLKSAMHIGAHVSAAGGVQHSITNSLQIGGNSFAFFLKSQRKWTSPPLAPEARAQFQAFCLKHKYDAAKHVLPHGSYLVNLAQPDPEKADQAYNCFLDDLRRCEALGIKLYNFHPGSTGKHPRIEAIRRIASQLNKAHKATKTVVTLLENMAGSGNVIGSTWEDLRDIIDLIDDKSRVGVCIDTCHSFAAGYDLRSPEAFKKTMDSFSEVVGMSYLRALHLNDSKAPLSSNRDLHANIGTGFLGLRAFHNVVNFAPFQDLPMVLETPADKKGPDGKTVEDKGIWAAEIKLLESLIGADPETDEFKKEEQRLQDVGAEERKKYQDQVDKKQQKGEKGQKTLDSMFKKAPAKKKKKAKKDEDESDSEGGCSH
ncbi:apurinic endonuclease [Drepanopeziza brunnea f. sp. 'multigermtubi' MB_m1]|uniref:Apurinic-apyrimidinic endonuclease 1 n=1 Tax=Marssonina brunnea f. sp. multigermtubi (strain MB_m1) TaxID=1072389 RepID=K1X654_MARBU|nr:apurinic endonuclease [Drepanopeziza brunnea f. sp. 'multigermtubi' MB_m1]EKD20607.1 apurinic endonuclease [Drepanopeziza brunnea f. sp. 'multigermtubi' MB_m1]